MKVKRAICILLAAMTIMAVLSSCVGGNERYYATDLSLFDTVTELSGYTESRARFDEIWSRVHGLLSHLHESFDIYNTYDGVNLASINLSKGSDQRTFEISAELYDLLTFGKRVCELTSGRVNIAMGSVLSLWHDSRHSDSPALPDSGMLTEAVAHTDIDSVELWSEGERFFISINDPYLTIDVGAIAKGYAARRATELLESLKKEGESLLLNLGGMVCPVGEKPGNLPWQVGIEYPSAERQDGYLRHAGLSSGALVTTAAHIRAFTVDGRSYGHVIDPFTLYPPERFAAVTVYCADPALGDALSTALFCMTEEEGRELCAALDGVGVMWVYPDMRVSTTEIFENILK